MSDFLKRIQSCLESGRLAEDLTPLFCETLHWGAPRGLMPRPLQVGEPFGKTLTAHPVAQLSGLPVFRIDWPENRLPGVTARRAVHRALASVYAEHLLCYITADGRRAAFTWAFKRPNGKTELRTLVYEVGSPARTTIEQLGELAFSLEELEPTGEPPITRVIDKLTAAFSVEAVTKQFFEDYKKVFADLQERLTEATGDRVWAHDYALQLLNRLMFLYFIQHKRWLGDDPRFLANFWGAYKKFRQHEDNFYSGWLSAMFFKAFNNEFDDEDERFPQEILNVLRGAPYLNGGLFTRNRLDLAYDVSIPDEFFESLFDYFRGSAPGFLERYNFTITESTPLDIEVAVDPEMIGKVYESLVNITSEGLAEEDLRGSAGIFYTPRVEIDLMCRLALVDTLANYLGVDKKPLLYDTVFALDTFEKESADAAVAKCGLWPKLSEVLRSLTVCDPACGSGSFLVGTLLVLDDLQARANVQLGIKETPYERRRRIIGEQLYGVDVMDWAVHVAELRLWLQLVVETELEPAKHESRPLLPNLSFKVRCGDSLVQEIGGINFGLHRSHMDIPSHLNKRIAELKEKKLRFYRGEAGLREDDLKNEELAILYDILQYKQGTLEGAIAKLKRKMKSVTEQGELFDMTTDKAGQDTLKQVVQWCIELDEKQAELSRIKKSLAALRTACDVPFVWDIAFVEIFEGEKRGFDIVIGNPPYVRQERIAPPTIDPTEYGGETSVRWKIRKEAYKAQLQQSIAAAWPIFFRFRPGCADFRKLDGKSDLYIYFYFHGLSLLNKFGSFCFITSNSWLDVDYGADLQEFLLRHSHIKFILDNEKKRSFAQADVNTIIALLAPPDDRSELGLERDARFVMFKVPFEDVLSSKTFRELEDATERRTTDKWRINVRAHRALLEEGSSAYDGEDPAANLNETHGPLIKFASYIGSKWGAKYLRMPEFISRLIDERKLIPLSDICKLEYGNKPGLKDFFIISDERCHSFEIEKQFLSKIITSTKEIKKLIVRSEDVKKWAFVCQLTVEELKRKGYAGAVRYVEWGSKQKTKKMARHTFGDVPWPQVPSVKNNRPEWHCMSLKEPGHFIVPLLIRERFFFAYNPDKLYDTNMFFHGTFSDQIEPDLGVAIINSTIVYLLLEIFGRHNIEGRFNIYGPELRALPIPNPELFDKSTAQEIVKLFEALAERDVEKILKEIRMPDRRALDKVVFQTLGLSPNECEEVYCAMENLVKARLEKAQSVKFGTLTANGPCSDEAEE